MAPPLSPVSGAPIEVRGLSWAYDPAHPVLREVVLSVAAGERLTLIGPNGAGKTTLLKCLNGLLRPARGTVAIAGRCIGSYAVRALARRVAYVPQPMSAGLPFRVRDFVMMGRYPHWSTLASVSPADRQAVARALAITGTDLFTDRIHATLSGGERQKVMLAAALAQETDVLLLDEPSAFLDPGHQQEIDAILLAVNRARGVTIVTATHDLNRAVLTSDRIVGLRDGALTSDLQPAAALRPEVLMTLYGTRFAHVAHPETGLGMILPRPPAEGRA